jgi:hypothetical protein
MALVLVVALTAPAAARPGGGWRFGGNITLSAEYATNDPATGDDRVHRLVLGESVRGVGGKPVGFALGLDVRLGAELPGAFVYRFAFMPLGLGVRFGKRGFLGVIGGIGPGGSVGRVPFAWELPLEAFLGFDLGRHVRVHASARVLATPWTPERENGSANAPFGDELELGFGMSFGKRQHDHYGAAGDGWYVGASYREQLGERMLGLVLALSIDAGGSDNW